MTMMSFRIKAEEAARVQAWADRLGVDRSELMREALRRHIVKLAAEDDIAAWENTPLTPEEDSFGSIADWGPAEDWSDWSDATG